MTKNQNDLEFFNVIGGKSRPADKYHKVMEPRAEEELQDAPTASTKGLDDAVAASQEAFKSFRWSTNADRRELLLAVRQNILNNVELLTAILTRETDKSELMAQIEVERAAFHFESYADTQLEDELQYEDDEVKILAQSVVPTRFYQALSSNANIGEQMTLHPGIAHISFTGTTNVERKIAAICARTVKKVILEMASSHASIVCEDVNLAEAVPKVAQACLFHAGQICVAAKRIYVHEMIYDELLNMLKKENKKYAIAEDASLPLMFDPLSNRVNYEQCLDILDDPPIIVTRPPEDSYLVAEEQFGPIIPVMSWADETDVIALSNIHNGGLGASFHTPDLDRAQKIARQLESGTVWINKSEIPHHANFVEGMKLSGYGGELGKQALLSYCYTDISIWEVMQCKKCMRAGLFL
ncbi:putative Aldehyde/histidinol dehydrogenase [Seiridium unicorne]|uniref:Succinate-semialdehyde dehydrogenase, mitochondrial n=1 Tax=Seiridium unicorne TaxID=138068 RepID=A0ABR2UIX1_9PEZI